MIKVQVRDDRGVVRPAEREHPAPQRVGLRIRPGAATEERVERRPRLGAAECEARGVQAAAPAAAADRADRDARVAQRRAETRRLLHVDPQDPS